jgi:hypothetical protein
VAVTGEASQGYDPFWPEITSSDRHEVVSLKGGERRLSRSLGVQTLFGQLSRACRHLADSQAWLELLHDAADSG